MLDSTAAVGPLLHVLVSPPTISHTLWPADLVAPLSPLCSAAPVGRAPRRPRQRGRTALGRSAGWQR
eukprot:366510-Chlamydomonas_euryale.AAC.12